MGRGDYVRSKGRGSMRGGNPAHGDSMRGGDPGGAQRGHGDSVGFEDPKQTKGETLHDPSSKEHSTDCGMQTESEPTHIT